MPTYDFRCPNGHEFSKFYKTISGSASEVPCEECSAVATRQLSGGAGLLFKGSGFYLTDYGKNAHRKPEAKTNEGGAKADGGKQAGDSGGTAPKDGAKPKSESSKAESAPKAESSKPKAESPKPK